VVSAGPAGRLATHGQHAAFRSVIARDAIVPAPGIGAQGRAPPDRSCTGTKVERHGRIENNGT